jgi:hypothetical protein
MIRKPTTYYFVNEGRAPAVVHQLHAARIPLAAMRTNEDGRFTFPAPLVIDPYMHSYAQLPHGASVSADGGKSVVWSTVDYGLAEEDKAGQFFIEWHLVGYVIYSDPVKSGQYITGFRLQFDHVDERWVLGGVGKNARRYNYSRQLHWWERAGWAVRGRLPAWRARFGQWRWFERARRQQAEKNADPPKE